MKNGLNLMTLLWLIILTVTTFNIQAKPSDNSQTQACLLGDYKNIFNCKCVEKSMLSTQKIEKFDFHKEAFKCKVSKVGVDTLLTGLEKVYPSSKFKTDDAIKKVNFKQCLEYNFKRALLRIVPEQFPSEEVRLAAYAELKKNGVKYPRNYYDNAATLMRHQSEKRNQSKVFSFTMPKNRLNNNFQQAYNICKMHKTGELMSENDYPKKLGLLSPYFTTWNENPNFDRTIIQKMMLEYDDVSQYNRDIFTSLASSDIVGFYLGQTLDSVYSLLPHPRIKQTKMQLQINSLTRNGTQARSRNDLSKNRPNMLITEGFINQVFVDTFNNEYEVIKGGITLHDPNAQKLYEKYSGIMEVASEQQKESLADNIAVFNNLSQAQFYKIAIKFGTRRKPLPFEELVSIDEWKPALDNKNIQSITLYANAFQEVSGMDVLRVFDDKLNLTDLIGKLKTKYSGLGEFDTAATANNIKINIQQNERTAVLLTIEAKHLPNKDGKSFRTTLDYNLKLNSKIFAKDINKLLKPSIIKAFDLFIDSNPKNKSVDEIRI
jgi:hypothetical protein